MTISITSIMQTVGSYYGVTRAELIGPRRHRRIAVPRMIVMYLCRDIRPELSLPHIGRYFGDKDHTTVLSARRRIAFLIGTDSIIAGQMGELRRILAGELLTPQFSPTAIARAAEPESTPPKPIRHPTDDDGGRKPQPLLYLATPRPEPVIARTVYRPVLMPSELRPITKAAMMAARAS